MTSPTPLPSASSSTSPAPANGVPPITHPLPTIESLQQASSALDTLPDEDRLAFAQDVLRVLDRRLFPSGPPTDFTHPDAAQPPAVRVPSALAALVNLAVPIIVSFTTHRTPAISALACYLKGTLLSIGSCPDFLPREPRLAFKEFEAAARGGCSRGWFRLGRDYEGVGDGTRAKDCFERGQKKGDCESTYRLGMAQLLGQLGLPINPATALDLLRFSAESATIDFPQPAYVYGMLLAGELSTPQPLPPDLVLAPTSPPTEAYLGQQLLAKDNIERAAYLCHASAQYKCGFLSEHAALGATYDPLMSVQWYSLASQGGEIEADMALSKWFLCGAEGHFGKNEELARTFAEKAARKGHPNGCFAMGYYFELGIGGAKDMDQAKKWYGRAVKLDNQDAKQRLAALSQPIPRSLSQQEHEVKVNDTLVRRRTQAKIRSDRSTLTRPPRRPSPNRQQEESLRIETVRAARAAATARQDIINSNTFRPLPNGLMSPSPRPDAFSPVLSHPAMLPSANSFPRPPIPHSGFARASVPKIEITHPTLPRRPSEPVIQHGRRVSASTAGGANGVVGSERRASPFHSAHIEGAAPVFHGEMKPKGPQTFAEMGFVSKPMEEEGCVVM